MTRIVPCYVIAPEYDSAGEAILADALLIANEGNPASAGSQVIFNTTLGKTRIWDGTQFITGPMANPDGGAWGGGGSYDGNPATINQDATHRFATDTEKNTWNGKQNALGFTPVADNDSRLSDARTPTAHSHPQSEVTNLVTDLSGKAATGHNHAGVYEPANSNIQTHIGQAHAPSNAQKNSDITKAEIEAVLTGVISSHSHAGGGAAIPTQYTFIGQQAWTNKATALQEFLNTNQRRLTIDMTNATQFRIISDVTVQGVSASVTGIQYSDDGGTTWRGLDNGTSGQNSTVTNSDLGTGSKVSAWTNLAAGAKADRIVRIAGSGGDGTADPAFSNISLQLK